MESESLQIRRESANISAPTTMTQTSGLVYILCMHYIRVLLISSTHSRESGIIGDISENNGSLQ